MTDDLYANNPERTDHYGRPSKWFMDYPEDYLDTLVDELKSVELIFRIEFGLQLYLTWGTLLGAMRDGDLIPHDFDIDVAYVSRGASEADVLQERRKILDHFKSFDRVLSGYSGGRFMLRAVEAPTGRYDHGIEIYTSFVTGGRYYGYSAIPGTLPAEAIEPFSEVTLRGRTFKAPCRSEEFLDQAIGEDWRVPRLPKDHTDRTRHYRCFEFLYPAES